MLGIINLVENTDVPETLNYVLACENTPCDDCDNNGCECYGDECQDK